MMATEAGKGRALREFETIKGSVEIFTKHVKKRTALEVASLMDLPAWWAVRMKHLKAYAQACASLDRAELSAEEQEHLRYAYRFAKAVYGQRMEEGYMDDAAHFIFLEATTAGMALKSEDEAKNQQALLKLAGLTDDHLLTACMHGETLKPAHACLLDHENRKAIICIRGTLTMEDALTNTAADAVQYAVLPSSDGTVSGGTVHQGMLEAAAWIADRVQASMVKAATSHPDYELIVTGHSLGAGAAAVLTLLLDQETDSRPRAYGFESLRGVGFATPGVTSKSISTDQHMTDIFTTVVFNRDVIPRLCVPKLDFMCYEAADENSLTKASEIYSKFRAGLKEGGAGLLSKLTSYEETKELKRRETGDVGGLEAEPHFPLGRCLLFAKQDSGAVQSLRLTGPQLNKIYFHELMFNDHILGQYGVAIGAEKASARAASATETESERRATVKPSNPFCCFCAA